MSLPEPVPPKLAAILDDLTPEDRALVETQMTHKKFGAYVTPAWLLASALTEHGTPISETTVKAYRSRVLDRQEVQV